MIYNIYIRKYICIFSITSRGHILTCLIIYIIFNAIRFGVYIVVILHAELIGLSGVLEKIVTLFVSHPFTGDSDFVTGDHVEKDLGPSRLTRSQRWTIAGQKLKALVHH